MCIVPQKKKNWEKIYDFNIIKKMHQTQTAGYSIKQLACSPVKVHKHKR